MTHCNRLANWAHYECTTRKDPKNGILCNPEETLLQVRIGFDGQIDSQIQDQGRMTN